MATEETKPGDVVSGPELVVEPEGLNEDHVATVVANLDAWTGAYGEDVIAEATKRVAQVHKDRDEQKRKAAASRAASGQTPTAAPEGRTSASGKATRA